MNMKIWQKFLVSSTILIGLICLMGSSVFRLYRAEIAAQKAQKSTAYALKITHGLEKSLKDQALSLKDFVVLNHNTAYMIKFQNIRSNFLIELKELELVMDEAAKDISFVHRRHAFLTNLADTLDSRDDVLISQQDLQAINSYIKDITFYLEDISRTAKNQNYAATGNLERIRQMNTVFLSLGIICIFLVFLFKLIIIIVPVIRSLHKLQIGVAKIGAGDLNYYLDIQTNDEIEQLADDFNQMTIKLRNFYYSLESRVTERTSELFQLNQDLQSEIIERKEAEIKLKQSQIELTQKAQQLQKTIKELQETQAQLIQKEKMSSLGQLVAGVAHEINNPVNFIHGNVTPLKEYVQNLIHLTKLYQTYYPQTIDEIEDYMEYIDLSFILEDTNKIITSLEIGTKRIREIVLSLRNFSRLDEADMKVVNIHEGIDNTLLILQHRIKGKAHHPEIEVIKEYGNLPLIECYPGQLNQVFMNILSNAIDALEGKKYQGFLVEEVEFEKKIKIQTKQVRNNCIAIHIEDNGMGIPKEHINQIFDPFFTTKPIGKGTGLGLSISYQVINGKHHGNLQCITKLGEGTEFIIELPIKQQNIHNN
ncbi:ATP-binding protein [Okeanomitos corallinicola TIOX110]|uniref:histidine kinase n=1 Tax=Okeanomitos corallinicola TIOX110 TaxID=3133117 RepID=A0ABZ2V246_9CYAN